MSGRVVFSLTDSQGEDLVTLLTTQYLPGRDRHQVRRRNVLVQRGLATRAGGRWSLTPLGEAALALYVILAKPIGSPSESAVPASARRPS